MYNLIFPGSAGTRRIKVHTLLANGDFDSPHSDQDRPHDDLASALIASATSAVSISAKRLLKHHPDYCSRHQPEGDDQRVISIQTQRRKTELAKEKQL